MFTKAGTQCDSVGLASRIVRLLADVNAEATGKQGSGQGSRTGQQDRTAGQAES